MEEPMAGTRTGRKTGKKPSAAKRLARYRARAARRGIRRVEVAVPGADVRHIRKAARAFREGGAAADGLRRQIAANPAQAFKIAKTGGEFMEMSRRITKTMFPFSIRKHVPPHS
jgi:hypothetical protein